MATLLSSIDICPALRVLKLEGFLLAEKPSNTPPVYGDFLLRLFETLGNNRLETIAISFIPAHDRHVPTTSGGMPWAEIEECLLGKAFPQLQTFSVTLQSSAGADANFEEEIRRQLGRLDTAGMLVFRLCVD